MIMVDIDKGMCMINGTDKDVVMESTIMLHTVWELLLKHYDEQTAAETFAEIGRNAVKTDDELGLVKA